MQKIILLIILFVKLILAKDTLHQSDCLSSNESIENGCFKLIMQSDGNLVLYRLSGYTPIWNSGTSKSCSNRACMQGDGNFVIYDCHNHATWNSGTAGNGGSRLSIQGDGNLVMYASNSDRPIWSSNSVTHC